MLALSRVAKAQAYPTRPVRIIVSATPQPEELHRRACDRTMAVEAAWPAIRDRHQHQHGSAARTGAARALARTLGKNTRGCGERRRYKLDERCWP